MQERWGSHLGGTGDTKHRSGKTIRTLKWEGIGHLFSKREDRIFQKRRKKKTGGEILRKGMKETQGKDENFPFARDSLGFQGK